MKMGVGFDFQNSILEKNVVPIRLESLYFISGCHNFQDISLHGDILICSVDLYNCKTEEGEGNQAEPEAHVSRGAS